MPDRSSPLTYVSSLSPVVYSVIGAATSSSYSAALEVTEKSDYLPNLAVGHDISPGGHGSPARAILNDVKVLVLRQARTPLHELGRPRIEGDAVITHGVIGPAVTVRTLVPIQTRAI